MPPPLGVRSGTAEHDPTGCARRLKRAELRTEGPVYARDLKSSTHPLHWRRHPLACRYPSICCCIWRMSRPVSECSALSLANCSENASIGLSKSSSAGPLPMPWSSHDRLTPRSPVILNRRCELGCERSLSQALIVDILTLSCHASSLTLRPLASRALERRPPNVSKSGDCSKIFVVSDTRSTSCLVDFVIGLHRPSTMAQFPEHGRWPLRPQPAVGRINCTPLKSLKDNRYGSPGPPGSSTLSGTGSRRPSRVDHLGERGQQPRLQCPSPNGSSGSQAPPQQA